MKILLVYPDYPDTFWSFKHALSFTFKKAVNPPLGLLTVAAMLPHDWQLKLIDMNIEKLKDKDIQWADYIFISAMTIQKESVDKVINKCKSKDKKIIAGGPLFTASSENYQIVDHLVLNEAEITLPRFLADFTQGKAKKIYTSTDFPSLEKTPLPRWDLVNMKKYVSINIQYSRGCPFNCEFCDITSLFGRQVRTKNKKQIIAELENLYHLGWQGSVFFVDDNFIGNKIKLKQEILPAIIDWMERRRRPFFFSTEASINLSDDDELMSMMVRAGFNKVFIGIETPDENSLAECNKVQNKNRNLVDCVQKIQKHGLEVTGGFIVGFDNDSPSIFQKQIEFIQKSGIITAMVGLLNAPKNTRLYKRLMEENRLLQESTGNNTDFSVNFIPKMSYQQLVDGYKEIVSKIYSPKMYYERVKNFLSQYNFEDHCRQRFQLFYVKALIKSIFVLGIKDKNRKYYWKLFFWSLFKKPQHFSLAITFAIYGFHFRKTFNI